MTGTSRQPFACRAGHHALREHLQSLLDDAEGGLALSLEMVEIDSVGSLKLNNLHERLSR